MLVTVMGDATLANYFIEYPSSLVFGTDYIMVNLISCTLRLFAIFLLFIKIGIEMDFSDAKKLSIKRMTIMTLIKGILFNLKKHDFIKNII